MNAIQPKNDFGLASKMYEIYRDLDTIRKVEHRDISLQDYIEKSGKFTVNGANMSYDQFLHDLGVEPNRHTIDMLISAPTDVRYLVPEIIREAIRLGLRRAPIYPNLIRGEESVNNISVTMPKLEFSGDTKMEQTNEAESIPYGYVSYGYKTVGLSKVGRGIQITYEAIRFTTINLVNVFFEDVGVRLGHSLDAMVIDTAINGDQEDGSESSAVVGVEATNNKITYYDLLRVWVRGGLIGRTYNQMIGNEQQVIDLMNLTEFKDKQSGETKPISFHVPVVNNPDVYPHINVPDTTLVLLDKNFAITQFTAQPLLVEGEQIVQRQLKGTYASLITGFANIFRDGVVVLDGTDTFVNEPWPEWMITGYAD